jgi:ribose-phosphate pyrophosphokinase
MITINGKEVEFTKFPNGETKINESSILLNLDPFLTNRIHFKYEEDGDLIKLMFVSEYMKEIKANINNHLLIYYMPYSRMDRSEDGSAFTLKYVTKFINSLGFESISVVEPHSDVTPALLDYSHSIMITKSLIPVVYEEIGFDPYVDYVVFPDAGAQKRYSKLEIANTLVGMKDRDFGSGVIEELKLVGNYNELGKKALIVDDLTSYGSTFVKTSEALKKLGFEEVYLLVGHAENSMLLPHPKTGVRLLDHVNKVFTTDTIINAENISVVGRNLEEIHQGLDKVKVYPISSLIE